MKILFRICLVFLSLVATSEIFAENKETLQPNQVMYDAKAEKYVEAKSTRVILSVDATFDNTNLADVRKQITSYLNLISPGISWNIIGFNIFQNDTGMNQLREEVEARLDEKALSQLNSRVKDISKPGINFKVLQLDPSPSLDEIELAKAFLRVKIYKDILAEVGRLNSIYTDNKYFVHSITVTFLENQPVLPVANLAAFGAPEPRVANNNADKSVPVPPLHFVSKIQMLANVVLENND